MNDIQKNLIQRDLDDAWEAHQSGKPYALEHLHSAVSRIFDELKRPDPVWTDELPKADGWYWFKDRNPKVEAKVVLVEVNGILGPLVRDGRLPAAASEWPGSWSGPIPAPREHKKGERRTKL